MYMEWQKVVDKLAATFSWPTEEILPLDADQRDLGKVFGSDDVNYLRILDILRRCMDQVRKLFNVAYSSSETEHCFTRETSLEADRTLSSNPDQMFNQQARYQYFSNDSTQSRIPV